MSNKRTIETAFNLKSGELIEVEDLLSHPREREEFIFRLRSKIEEHLINNVPEFVCVYCKQPIVLRGLKNQESGTTYFFKHQHNSDDCPIKTDSQFTKEEIERIKYNRVKESDEHIRLKNAIASHLKQELGDDQVFIEKVVKSEKTPKEWRKPDVLVHYKNLRLALELQLSTTFLTVIVGRTLYYKNEGIFLLWIFPNFSVEQDLQRFTQKDVYYNNKLNVYIFDKEAEAKSILAQKLILKCLYRTYTIQNFKLVEKWETAFITLEDLTFDNTTIESFYKDIEDEKKQWTKTLDKFISDIAEENRKKEEERLKIITENDIQTVRKFLKAFYEKDYNDWPVNPLKEISRRSISELNKVLQFNGKYLHVIANCFIRMDKPVFLKFVASNYSLDVDFNLIKLNDLPIIQYILDIEDPSKFHYYLTCLFLRKYEIGDEEKKCIDNLYNNNHFKSSDKEREYIRRWGLVNLLTRLRTKSLVADVIKNQHLLLTLESLRINYSINYKFSSLVQMSHSFLDMHSEYSDLYLGALHAYNQEKLQLENDTTRKLKEKLERLRSSTHYQEKKEYPLVRELFPTINF